MANTLLKFLASDDTNPDEVHNQVEKEFNNIKLIQRSLASNQNIIPSATARSASTTARPFINPVTGQEIPEEPEEPIPKRQMVMSSTRNSQCE